MRAGVKLAFLIAVLLVNGCGATRAPGGISVDEAWIAAPTGGDGAAGFARIRNSASQVDRLVSASTQRASHTMLHDMTMTDGMVSMRALQSGLSVAPGGEVVLSPQGAHVMLMGVNPPLRMGERVNIDLNFEYAGRVTVPFVVMDRPPSAMHAGHN